MLTGDDIVPSTSVLYMAKGKNSQYSSRVSPSFPMEVSANWEHQPDFLLSQRADPESVSNCFTVGYALTSKKTKSFIQPKLIEETRNKGIKLIAIDSNISLAEQGPFHVILHKIPGKDWRIQLEDYQQKYPATTVIDSPESIQQLRNRQSMLQAVVDADLRACGGRVGVPKQLVITSDLSDTAALVKKQGLNLPLVVKPLVADGTAKSHSMYLAYNADCLASLDPPFVLQEFVNHGGVLFKVYVVGHVVRVVKRLSLPDVHSEGHGGDGLTSFERISSASAAAKLTETERYKDLPPHDLLEALASELRKRLGLQLFNIDLIREGGTSNGYYVIDINYFPGYGKVPNYESAFAEFLESLALSKRKGKRADDTSLRKPPNIPSDLPP